MNFYKFRFSIKFKKSKFFSIKIKKETKKINY